MNDQAEKFAKPRQAVIPPLSNRTLHHPSFLPAYMSAASAQYTMACNNLSVLPIIPSEFFYTDPTLSCGRRIPNIVSDLRVLECFQLNTPAPIMSACPAPPNRPDPFRAGPHPTKNLGSPTWRMEPVLPSRRAVVQLTQEEDQAITNLLKLNLQEPAHRPGRGAPIGFNAPLKDHASGGESLMDNMDIEPSPSLGPSEQLLKSIPPGPTSPEGTHEPFCSGGQHTTWAAILGSQLQHARLWSDMELEAANTLLTRLSLSEEDCPWNQNYGWKQCSPTKRSPDRLQYPLQESSSMGTETQPASQSWPSLISGLGYNYDSTQKNLGYTNVGCFGSDNAEPPDDVLQLSCGGRHTSPPTSSSSPPSSLSSDSEVESQPSVFGDLLGVREGTLTESEGTAVCALLSLGLMETPDMLQ